MIKFPNLKLAIKTFFRQKSIEINFHRTMTKKKRVNLTMRKGAHRKKIAKAMAKRRFEQESSNFRNQETGPPCTILKEDTHENKLRFPVYRNAEPFIRNNCDVIESGNSIKSVVCNYVKIEKTDEVSVENTMLYQPKHIVDRNVIDEQYTNGSGSSCSQKDPARFSVYQKVKPFIQDKCDVDVIESGNSIQSVVRSSVKIEQTDEVSVENTVLHQPKYTFYRNCISDEFIYTFSQEDPTKSVKIEENDEVSVENTVLYQPKYTDITAGNSIAQQSTDGSGYIMSAEDATSSCFSHPGNWVELGTSFNEILEYAPNRMLCPVEKRKTTLEDNRSVNEVLPRESSSHFTTPQIYQCQFCDHTATEMYKLHVHINSFHIKLKYFKCKYCYFKVFSENDLVLHVDNVCTSVYK
ncbi:hypothetical protein WA026_013577 [Henosepilachna vigintioctopunctata]|uniref:C2H2-type domain-containing protein n=1 Tax=Henosepilachna vigintioctopunctata TaxID=420089 RepID=A0AAW1V6D5_9CUCU